MNKRLFAALAAAVFLSGCATVGSRKTGEATPDAMRVKQLETDIETRNQKIDELEGDLQRMRSGTAAPTVAAVKSGVIRVAGVTVTELQAALKRAGLDPGPMDGKLGTKTKEAVKEFQRRKNLKADGVVGAKTWALLK
jgi:peptidoglycan hydrolase-like protein with peptidoglycan-binding domain